MRLCLLLLTALLCSHGFAQTECATSNYTDFLIKKDPRLSAVLKSVNDFTHQVLNSRERPMGAYGTISAPQLITIPVVVHILYNNEKQNISTAQVQSQLDQLNADFRKRTADTSRIPEQFRNLAADCYLEFKLASVDPQGKPSSGIVRKKTGIQFFGLDDRIKSTARGGSDAWDSKQYLNIWVGNLAGGIVGYSSPLGGPAAYDGVVIRTNAFGTTGNVSAPLNKGRTAVHEIGHWLGLYHIWGDRECGDDYVADTPPQQMASRGCPTGGGTSCNNSGDMYMNFMDFSNDACMFLFTKGQSERMRAAFKPGGLRYSLLSSAAAKGNAIAEEQAPTEQLKQETVSFFPNPVNDVLQVNFKNGGGQANIIIYNQLGQVVKTASGGKSSLRLNVQELRKGIYFVRTEENSVPYRFVKN